MSTQWERDYAHRYHEESDPLAPARGIVNAAKASLAAYLAIYFVGWWVVPFFKALWRAR